MLFDVVALTKMNEPALEHFFIFIPFLQTEK